MTPNELNELNELRQTCVRDGIELASLRAYNVDHLIKDPQPGNCHRALVLDFSPPARNVEEQQQLISRLLGYLFELWLLRFGDPTEPDYLSSVSSALLVLFRDFSAHASGAPCRDTDMFPQQSITQWSKDDD